MLKLKMRAFALTFTAGVFSMLFLAGCDNPGGSGVRYDSRLVLDNGYVWVGTIDGIGIAAALKNNGTADVYVKFLWDWTDGNSADVKLHWWTARDIDKLTIIITRSFSGTYSGMFTLSENGNTLTIVNDADGEVIIFTKTPISAIGF